MTKTAIFIGRFQPLHFGHLAIIDTCMQDCEQLIMVVGSINRARTVKNPFTFTERKILIEQNLQAHAASYLDRTKIVGVEDNPYDDVAWQTEVTAAVKKEAVHDADFYVVGHDKDESTFYLKMFPNWQFIACDNHRGINATDLRYAYFAERSGQRVEFLPEVSQKFLQEFKRRDFYTDLLEEYQFLASYKESWAESPYPPIFTTVDSVVTHQDQVLLIKRKFTPGKNLWALPGGFIEAHEWVQTGILRELREETQLDLTDAELSAALKNIKVFDHPSRSQIGRVITHAGLFKLTGSEPEVKAADDALECAWVALAGLTEFKDKLHDDHYFIINKMLNLN